MAQKPLLGVVVAFATKPGRAAWYKWDNLIRGNGGTLTLNMTSEVTHVVAYQNDSNSLTVKTAMQTKKAVIVTEAYFTDSIAAGQLCDPALYNPFGATPETDQKQMKVVEKEQKREEKGKEKESDYYRRDDKGKEKEGDYKRSNIAYEEREKWKEKEKPKERDKQVASLDINSQRKNSAPNLSCDRTRPFLSGKSKSEQILLKTPPPLLQAKSKSVSNLQVVNKEKPTQYPLVNSQVEGLLDLIEVWPMINNGVAVGCGIPFFPSEYTVEAYSVIIREGNGAGDINYFVSEVHRAAGRGKETFRVFTDLGVYSCISCNVSNDIRECRFVDKRDLAMRVHNDLLDRQEKTNVLYERVFLPPSFLLGSVQLQKQFQQGIALAAQLRRALHSGESAEFDSVLSEILAEMKYATKIFSPIVAFCMGPLMSQMLFRTCLGVNQWEEIAKHAVSVRTVKPSSEPGELALMAEDDVGKHDLDEDIQKKLTTILFILLKAGRLGALEWYSKRRVLPILQEFAEPAFSLLVETNDDGKGFVNEYLFRLMLPFLVENQRKILTNNKNKGKQQQQQQNTNNNNGSQKEEESHPCWEVRGTGLERVRSIEFVAQLIACQSPAIDRLLLVKCSRMFDAILWPTHEGKTKEQKKENENENENENGNKNEKENEKENGWKNEEEENHSLLSYCVEALFTNRQSNIMHCQVVKVLKKIFARDWEPSMGKGGEESVDEEGNESGVEDGSLYSPGREPSDPLQRFILMEFQLVPKLMEIIRMSKGEEGKEEIKAGRTANFGHAVQVCNLLVGNSTEGGEIIEGAKKGGDKQRKCMLSKPFIERVLGLSEEAAKEWQTFLLEDLPRINSMHTAPHSHPPPKRPTNASWAFLAQGAATADNIG